MGIVTVVIYAGNAGDRNDRAMRGAIKLGSRIAADLGVTPETIGSPAAVVPGGWPAQLQAASPNLRRLSEVLSARWNAGEKTVLTMGRCAAGLATLPVVAGKFPDTLVLWFDAHGDCNVPVAPDNYLGGMVLSGAAGEWETGLGSGLDLAKVILVGARDLDDAEWARVECGQLRLIQPHGDFVAELQTAIRGRQVYIQLDCDVLSAGLLATEYQSPNGLGFDQLQAAFEMLSRHDLVGLEIAEYEDSWPDGRPSRVDELLAAICPVIEMVDTDALGP